MSTRLWLVLATAVVIFVYVSNKWTESTRAAENREKQKLAQEYFALQSSIDELTQQYSAVADWNTGLGIQGLEGKVYSAHLRERMVREDNRPILLYASLEDVQRVGRFYVAHFKAEDYPFELFVDLVCTREQAAELLNQPPQRSENLYVVISSVQDVASDNSGIEKRFRATGNCASYLNIGARGSQLAVDAATR